MARQRVNSLSLAQRGQDESAGTLSTVQKELEHLDAGAIRRAVIEHGQSMVIGAFQFGRSGLQVTGAPSREQWESIGSTLLLMAHGGQWWIGDWLNIGERQWGKTYQDVAAQMGYKARTLKDWAYVARNVDSSIRIDELTFGHHQLIASMPQRDQVKWLRKAIENDWSISQMREFINPNPTPLLSSVDRFMGDLQAMERRYSKVGEGDRQQFVILLRQLLDRWESG